MQLHAVSGSFYCQIVLTITLGAKQPLDPWICQQRTLQPDRI